MSDIVLDRDSHVYRHKGRVLPGVTTILAPICDLSMVPPAALEFARQRGHAVHKALELYNNGALDYETVDDEVGPRLRAYMQFLKDSGYTPRFNERIVHHATLDYCGTLDTFGTLGDGSAALIDYKTGAIEAAAALQTAAYRTALAEELPEAAKARRYALWLGVDDYKLIPFNDARDWSVFLSLLNIHKWTQSNGRRNYY